MFKRLTLAALAMVMATPLYAQNLSVAGQILVNAISVTATAGSSTNTATCNAKACIVTSAGTLTIASTGDYTIVVSNSNIAVGDIVLASIIGGTSTAGVPVIKSADTSVAGRVTFTIANAHIQTATNGTLKLAAILLKQ